MNPDLDLLQYPPQNRRIRIRIQKWKIVCILNTARIRLYSIPTSLGIHSQIFETGEATLCAESVSNHCQLRQKNIGER